MWMIEIECGANGENIQCRPAVKFYVTSKFLKHWTKQVVFENYLQHKQPFEDFFAEKPMWEIWKSRKNRTALSFLMKLLAHPLTLT